MARIFTLNDVENELKRLNRDYQGRSTWGQMYGSVDLSRQRAVNSATRDYSKAIGEAYASSFAQKNAIANSSLLSGYKEEAYQDLDLALAQAYDSYQANYLSQLNSIETNASTANAQIDEMLSTQASNVKSYQKKPYEYLTYLYNRSIGTDKMEADDKLTELFANDAQWSKYLVDVLDEKGEATGEKRLVTRDELYKDMYDANNALTARGADFYDQMLNQLGERFGDEYSFDTWLYNNDEELFQWSQSYNPYDYSPDAFGNSTNLSSIRTLFGLTSDDDRYRFIERFGGMNEQQINDYYSDFQDKLNVLTKDLNEASGRYTKKTTEDIKTLTAEVESLAKDLGIHESIEKELGMTWEELNQALDYNVQNSVTNAEVWWNNILNHVGVGATTGNYVGAAVGSVIPGAGTTIGAAAGIGVGAIAGLYSALIRSAVPSWNSQLEANVNYAKDSKRLYEDLIVSMINYSQNIRRQAEINQNKT